MERALHFTAAVQAVGASERDGAGAAGVAGRVHGFGATGGDTDLYGRLRVRLRVRLDEFTAAVQALGATGGDADLYGRLCVRLEA